MAYRAYMRRSGVLFGAITIRQKSTVNAAYSARLNSAQLRALFVASAVPMIGFGFMDNMIMIGMGDLIDTTIGVKFGVATLTAAAFGQIFSDVAGVCSGSAFESVASRVGVQPPDLSYQQRRLRAARFTATAGAVIGVITGCLLGLLAATSFTEPGQADKKRRTEELDALLHTVFKNSVEVLNAEASTLFIVDHKTEQVWSRVANVVGNPQITRYSFSEGVAGAVAATGVLLNVKDASKDSRYSSAWSERGAFATRSALCVPVKNGEGTVIAVVEVLNKMDTGGKPSAFDASDEKAVQLLASHVAALLQQLDLTAKH